MNEEQVRAIVERAITERTQPEYQVYFFDGKWLVTYDALIEHADLSQKRAYDLEKRIARLERPWWKRWLSR